MSDEPHGDAGATHLEARGVLGFRRERPMSGYQLAMCRIALGGYIVWRLATLGDEAMGGPVPHPMLDRLTPVTLTVLLPGMLLLSVLLTLGIWRRVTSALLLIGGAWLWQWRDLADAPSIIAVAVVLAAMIAVPPGEPVRLGRHRADWPGVSWWVFVGVWSLMAIGYSIDGLAKLVTDPSWIEGDALGRVAGSRLTRSDTVRAITRELGREVSLAPFSIPTSIVMLATWTVLAFELLFLPACLTRRTRFLAWSGLTAVNLGFLFVMRTAEHALAVLIIHLFTFDRAWFPPRPTATGRATVYYDGTCALCHGATRFLIEEDLGGVLSFAPLQGETFARLSETVELEGGLDSIVYARDEDGALDVSVRSTAILRILRDIGGMWRVVSWARIIPRPLRDATYDLLARRRYRWFGRYETCRLPTASERVRLLP